MNTLDVNQARKRLVDALGESSKSYFAYLKDWFCMKASKEEFDRQARLLLANEHIHLHNEFLLAIITKCQSLCQPSSTNLPVIKQESPQLIEPDRKKPMLSRKISATDIKPVTIARHIKPKTQPTNHAICFENRFQPTDTSLSIQNVVAYSSEKPSIKTCTSDLALPDAGFIHGRMLLAAWNAGLDQGCQDMTIELVLAATKQFLKGIITAVVCNKKGYRLRENKFVHSVGLPTLNPWVHNSWGVHDSSSNSYATDISQHGEPPHAPAIPPLNRKAERDSAFYIACSTENDLSLKPISVLDVFQTLQVNKDVIPCHTVYAVNLERISQRLYHPD